MAMKFSRDRRILLHWWVVSVLLLLPLLSGCELYFASKHESTGGIICSVLGRQVVEDGGRTPARIEGVPLRSFLSNRIGHEVNLIDELKTEEALESSCDG